jgi:hypothetical protein
MIFEILSLGATTANDLDNPIVIPEADKARLRARFPGVSGDNSTRELPQALQNAIVFADVDWTSGTWTAAVTFEGANGKTTVCTTTSGEITGADGLFYLTPAAGFLQNASSEIMIFPLRGPNGELPQVDVTEASAGALVTLKLYVMIPDN